MPPCSRPVPRVRGGIGLGGGFVGSVGSVNRCLLILLIPLIPLKLLGGLVKLKLLCNKYLHKIVPILFEGKGIKRIKN